MVIELSILIAYTPTTEINFKQQNKYRQGNTKFKYT